MCKAKFRSQNKKKKVIKNENNFNKQTTLTYQRETM